MGMQEYYQKFSIQAFANTKKTEADDKIEEET